MKALTAKGFTEFVIDEIDKKPKLEKSKANVRKDGTDNTQMSKTHTDRVGNQMPQQDRTKE
ncbi:hypothetical protein [Helicobacter bizzozeronii]|uniref:hypothetical protein n=1 Tax=Helicobacter bizzozeronii TaxID=56877 RepID=UPI000CF09B19|nr:hypothetical protein [Helicobacter bizzozeronii]